MFSFSVSGALAGRIAPRYQKDLLSTGLTTVQTDDFKLWDATIDDILAAYEELDKEGKLNVRFIQQLRLITDAQLEDYSTSIRSMAA